MPSGRGQEVWEGMRPTMAPVRVVAGLPPFASLALLRAEAKDAAQAAAFLRAAAERAAALPESAGVMVYPPVPPAIARVAGRSQADSPITAVKPAPDADITRFMSAMTGVFGNSGCGLAAATP